MAPSPIALPPALPSELLEYVLAHQAYPTTLLICQPRGFFLSSLSKAVKHTSPDPSLPDLDVDIPPNPTAPEEPPQRHPLLIPTLQQVATSRSIDLAFIPTVTHLRAYSAAFPGPETKAGHVKQEWEKKGKNIPLLVIYGVVGLHKDTSEWSAQGLGNSLSGCVEAAWRSGRSVVLIEEKKVEEEEDDIEVVEERLGDEGDIEPARGGRYKVWEERVPMLNGSVRRAGLESEEGGWSGRTVEVGRVLARWFKFRKGSWESEDAA